MFAFLTLLAPFFLPQTLARFPCANGGEPFSADAEKAKSSVESAFSCQCPDGYFGTFCEYRTNSADGKNTPKTDQQQKFSSLVNKFENLFPPPGSDSAGTDSVRSVLVHSEWHWQEAVVNLLVCVFFLLILPSLVVYIVRIAYLFLKRCHQRNRTTPPATAMPTPPPQYFPSMDNNFQFRPNANGRHRSESPGVTEVIVQLPTSVCRPLHGTHSLNIRPTNSLTLHEFHSLLLAMQREMVAEQLRECESQSRRLDPSALSPALPPVGPPPNYESALLNSHYP